MTICTINKSQLLRLPPQNAKTVNMISPSSKIQHRPLLIGMSIVQDGPKGLKNVYVLHASSIECRLRRRRSSSLQTIISTPPGSLTFSAVVGLRLFVLTGTTPVIPAWWFRNHGLRGGMCVGGVNPPHPPRAWSWIVILLVPTPKVEGLNDGRK